MDITIKIDLTENTIKALHEVAAAITQPKGVRVSLADLADATNNLQQGTTKAEPAAPDAVEETPKQEEQAKAEPAKKPATKRQHRRKQKSQKPKNRQKLRRLRRRKPKPLLRTT